MTTPRRLSSMLWVALVPFAALGAWNGQLASTAAQSGGGSARRHASVTSGMDCSACHTPDGWGMAAGAEAGRGFDHARTGFPLVGRHSAITCVRCHQADVQIERDCVSCHEDAHQSRLGRDCERCHTAVRWSDTRPFEIHRTTRLPLTGMHALLDCTECHRRTGDREFTAVPADCFSCHEADYRRPDTHPDHTGTTGHAPFPRDCAMCHVTIGWSPAFVDPTAVTGALASAPPEHESIFPIRIGPHREIACVQCHLAPEVPRAVECTGCHTHDPVRLRQIHGGELVATDGAGCLGCHPGGSAR